MDIANIKGAYFMSFSSSVALSIKQRLILMAAVSIFSLVTLFLLGNYATHKVEALERAVVKAAYIEVDMLTLRRNEKDFLARKDLKYQEKFNGNFEKMLADTEEDHAYWLEKQLGLIKRVGLQNYLQSQI